MSTTPKVIAHRGYYSKYPENTWTAFDGAVKVGAYMIETDLQVTKDGYIVISHDDTTGRLYDKDLKINDSNLEDLMKLKNKADPTQGFITFTDLLKWSVKNNSRLMLDIKANNSKSILAKIVRDLIDVKDDLSYWYDRIVFGLWRLDFYKFGVMTGLISKFEVINITFTPLIAMQFIKYSKTLPPDFKLFGISMLDYATWDPAFKLFKKTWLDDNGINLYLWTINTPLYIKKALNLKVYGILTDNPVAVQQAIEARAKLQKDFAIKEPSFFSIAYAKSTALFTLYKVLVFTVLHRLHENFIVKNLFKHGVKYIVTRRDA